MAGDFRLVQPTLKIVVSFFCGLLMHYRAKPFGKTGRNDDALIDRILNSCLIADYVSCIQNLSSFISIIVELNRLASCVSIN